jgi:hypothetical protein
VTGGKFWNMGGRLEAKIGRPESELTKRIHVLRLCAQNHRPNQQKSPVKFTGDSAIKIKLARSQLSLFCRRAGFISSLLPCLWAGVSATTFLFTQLWAARENYLYSVVLSNSIMMMYNKMNLDCRALAIVFTVRRTKNAESLQANVVWFDSERPSQTRLKIWIAPL